MNIIELPHNMTTTAPSTSTYRPRARSGSILGSQRMMSRALATGNIAAATRKERVDQCGPAMTSIAPLKVSYQQRPLRAQPALPPPSSIATAKTSSTSTSSPSRGAKRPAPPAAAAAVPIPLPSSHIPRTKSELQLREDTVAAEWADLAMFHRLVNGMRDRHQRQQEQFVHTSTPMVEQQQRRRQEIDDLRRHQHQRSLYHPAPPSRGTQQQTERCIDSIICTRQAEQSQQEHGQEDHDARRRRHIVSPETTATVLPSRNDQDHHHHHGRLETLHSALSQAANEDWSLEGYYDDKITNAKEEDLVDAGGEDDADADGIFSLDL